MVRRLGMASILFLTVHRPDRSPSQRFRFEQYIEHFQKNGYQTKHSYCLNENEDRIFYSKGNLVKKGFILLKSIVKRLKEVATYDNYDIVFVQREALMLGSTIAESLWQRRGAKLIFDFDDSIWLPNVSDNNAKFSWLKGFKKVNKLIHKADLVIAGNQYLASYALKLNNNTHIIPTTINTSEYTPNRTRNEQETIVIGWSGSKTTVQHFETVVPALRRIKKKYGRLVRFELIGDENYVQEELELRGLPWRKNEEVDLISNMDIGLMPLPNDEWAEGKCGLKGLQYMALEVATIMSPVGVNSTIIQQGINGLLASSEDDWVDALSILIEDSLYRKEIGKAGRQTVLKEYSVDAQKQKLIELVNSTLC